MTTQLHSTVSNGAGYSLINANPTVDDEENRVNRSAALDNPREFFFCHAPDPLIYFHHVFVSCSVCRLASFLSRRLTSREKEFNI